MFPILEEVLGPNSQLESRFHLVGFIFGKIVGIFYLPHLPKIENLEFIFAINGPQLARRALENRIITVQNTGLFYFT